MKLNVCMYHYTRDLIHSRYPGIKGLDVKLLREQLSFFKDNFNVVKMEDVLTAYGGGVLLSRKMLCY